MWPDCPPQQLGYCLLSVGAGAAPHPQPDLQRAAERYQPAAGVGPHTGFPDGGRDTCEVTACLPWVPLGSGLVMSTCKPSPGEKCCQHFTEQGLCKELQDNKGKEKSFVGGSMDVGRRLEHDCHFV